MIAFLEVHWWTAAINTFLVTLNDWVYSLVTILCRIFMDIGDTPIFSDELITSFTNRIYVVLGILMLFKLVFSLLTSIVNPDNLVDKEKGMGKIVTRTIMVLVMLIMVPTVFEYAISWQSKIASTVPKIILGTSADDAETQAERGELLAGVALKTFLIDNPSCPESSISSENVSTIDDVLELAKAECSNEKLFKYDFNGFVGLVAGIIMVVMLASFCVDIAVRTIKLGLLQVLAPIPIISYIDPKAAKSGAFNNWLKECGSTYAELFIKLGILYFVLFVLSSFAAGHINTGSDPYVMLFIILGTFFFMGKAAEFICSILGVKAPSKNGGFLKGLTAFAGVGGIIGGALGTAAGGVSGAWTNARDAMTSAKVRNGGPLTGWNKGKAIAAAIGSGGVGAVVGSVTAGKAAVGAKNGKMGAAVSSMYKRNAAHAAAAAGGATFGGKASSYFQRAFTGGTIAEKVEKEISVLDEQAKSASAIVSHADDKAKTSKYTVGISKIKDSNGNTKQVVGNYQQWSASFNAAKAQGLSSFSFNGTNVTMEEAERLDYGLFTSNSECYIKNQGTFRDNNNRILATDEVFEQKIADSIASNPNFVFDANTTRGDVKEYIDKVNVEKSKKTRDLKIAKANADAVKPK